MNTKNILKQIRIAFLNVALIAVGGWVLVSCSDDDPVTPPNEEELITTLSMVFTPQGGGTAVTLRFFDEDGADGPIAPTASSGTLAANTTYDVQITVMNESETPAEDITPEIRTEDAAHQFFFAKTASLNLTFGYADMDGNGNPVGLATTFVTGAASTGQLTVILRHEPNKTASGVSNGDITNAGGETDVETTPPFDITIQ